MSSAQLRLAETIDTFYGASDKASHNAIAANAYKRSVEELDAGVSRELVCGPQLPSITRLLITMLGSFSLPFFDRMPPIARPSSIRSAR
jgi:hypothetical protein